MPPVFGPSSPSRSRLKSCAGSMGSTDRPSQIANSDTSGPSRNSSITTRPHDAACARALPRSAVTTTPLPAARASSFTTYGGPNASSAASTSSDVSHTWAIAVGMPAAAMTSFANAFEPSIGRRLATGSEARRSPCRARHPRRRPPRGLRADHDEVDAELTRKVSHRGTVEDVCVVQRGERGDPGVAGDRVQLGHVRVAGEGPDERVLAPTTAEQAAPSRRAHTSSRSTISCSRPGPTPMPQNGVPDRSSRARTYALALGGRSAKVRQPEMSSAQPSKSS